MRDDDIGAAAIRKTSLSDKVPAVVLAEAERLSFDLTIGEDSSIDCIKTVTNKPML